MKRLMQSLTVAIFVKLSSLKSVRFLSVHAFTSRVLCSLAGFFFLQCTSNTAPPPAANNTLAVKETQTGLASYYGRGFEGKETASGETFHSREMVAAHPSYQLGTVARVTNLQEGVVVQVRIIDRGPTAENVAEGVIIDVSKGAAEKLRMVSKGRVRVKVEVLQWGTNEYKPGDSL